MFKTHSARLRIVLILFSTIVGFYFFARVALPAQEFRITSVRVTNNSVRVAWDAPGGSNYVVQSATNLASTNFTNVSQVIFIPGSLVQPTNFTHTNGLLNSTSRFYRVSSFSIPPVLQINPTNAIIGKGMTNRYKVLLVYANNTTNDVTGTASLTSSNTTVAQLAGSTNGFALLRGVNNGAGSLQAVYQLTNGVSLTNTVSLTVTQFIGMDFQPPLSVINGFVAGQSTNLQVFGILPNLAKVNITPSSTLSGDAATSTRVTYDVRADVANSLALVTGGSAAAGDVWFTAGDLHTTNLFVNWCWFTSVSLQPRDQQINIGETRQFTFTGTLVNGSTISGTNVTFANTFSSDFLNVEADLGTLRVTGVNSGTDTIRINVNNGPGGFCSGGLNDSLTLSVVCPGFDQVDQTFNAGFSGSSFPRRIAQQPDGKIIVGGSSPSLVRLKNDGSGDNTFQPGSGPNGQINAIAVQPDGKILIGGSFDSYNGTNRSRIARLLTNASLDTNFTPSASGSVEAIIVQPDGKILIGGSFTSINGTNRNGVARLNSDGTLDTGFNPGTSPGVAAMALRPDGAIYIAGAFAIRRLNSNGSLDNGFSAGTGPNGDIKAVAVQSDGKVLIGGLFSTYNGSPRNSIARLTATGSLETFNPNLSNGSAGQKVIYAIAVQPDGKIILGGKFNHVAGILTYQNLARFDANGGLDGNFLPCGAAAMGDVVAISQDICRGQAHVCGNFVELNGVSRYRIGRLLTGSVSSPSNDNFSGRIVLAGSTVTTNANNDCASKESGEPNHAANNPGGKSLWWSWIAPLDGIVTISTCGSDFDTLLAVYTGTSASELTLVTNSNDNVACGTGSLQSQAQFNAIAGTTYQIAVDGFKFPDEPTARSGNVSLSINVQPTDFAQWDFDSVAPDEDAGTGILNPSLGTGTAAYVGGVVEPGSGTFGDGSPDDPDTDDNSGWATSNYPGSATGNKTAGVRFNVSTAGRENIVISWDQLVSLSASKYVRFQYSTNGVNFLDAPGAIAATALIGKNGQLYSVFETQTNNLSGIPGVNNNPNFAFRVVTEFESTAIGTTNTHYVGLGGTYAGGGIFSGGGTISFDMVTISGVPISP